MNLLTIIITLIVVGFLLWVEEKYIPMDAFFKIAIRVIAIVATVIWLLHVFGFWSYLGNVKI